MFIFETPDQQRKNTTPYCSSSSSLCLDYRILLITIATHTRNVPPPLPPPNSSPSSTKTLLKSVECIANDAFSSEFGMNKNYTSRPINFADNFTRDIRKLNGTLFLLESKRYLIVWNNFRIDFEHEKGKNLT